MKYTVALALFATVAAYDNINLADDPPKDDKKKDDTKKDEKKAAPYCAMSSVKKYSDDKCTKDEKPFSDAELKAFNENSAAAKECVATGDASLKVTCDTASFKTTVYKDDKCTAGKEDKATSVEVKWTECSKLADGQFVKATGAKALLVGAAAALAFVGSQF